MDSPLSQLDSIREFSWRRDQRHRPGLEYPVSTGQLHGCESQTEARVLIALDFLGALIDVVSQPVKITFGTGDKPREHTPDFLAVTRSGVWLIDVRPERLIKDEDRESFAAVVGLALACGWQYAVVADWRPHTWAAVDALSSQRRPISDPLGLRPGLLQVAAGRGVSFGELARASGCEPVARAQLLHLIWRRSLGVDLSVPLADASIVVAADRALPRALKPVEP